jgi:hypothetical protein
VGAKTALLAFAENDIRPVLRGATRLARSEAEELVRRLHPDHTVEPAGEGTLLDGVYPPQDIAYAAVWPGVELLCDRRFIFGRPSELPDNLLATAGNRRIIVHGMHSAADELAFAVWEAGELVRSLSLSPDGGIQENIGEPYDFEVPYWAGEHPVRPTPDWHDHGPYPLPFHPLELGKQALRALFGFILEGSPQAEDIDADTVSLYKFRVTDPTGAEQTARAAQYGDLPPRMGPPQRFRYGPDGKLSKITDVNP